MQDWANIYNSGPPPHGREAIIIGDGCKWRAECVSIVAIFLEHTDERHTLFDVTMFPCRPQPVLVACNSADPRGHLRCVRYSYHRNRTHLFSQQ